MSAVPSREFVWLSIEPLKPLICNISPIITRSGKSKDAKCLISKHKYQPEGEINNPDDFSS